MPIPKFPLYNANLDLTHSCNLKCIHCYEYDNKRIIGPSFRKIKDVLDQLRELNCIQIGISGGEALIRPDFLKICEYARRKGFALTIFTNATLMNERIAKKLKEYNVRPIKVSLYGSNPKVHETVTQKKGSFLKTINGIRLLKKQGLEVYIAIVILKSNVQDLDNIVKLCNKLGCSYNYSPHIRKSDFGGEAPLKLRLEKDQFLEIGVRILRENGDPSRSKNISHICGAGRNALSIDATGNIYPCVNLPIPAGNIYKDKIKKVWSKAPIFKKLRKTTLKNFKKCRSCKYIPSCDYCIGTAWFATGNIFKPDEFLCYMFKNRMKIYHKQKK